MNLTAIQSTASLTMTSREIAELTGKRHDNVMADIRRMLEELSMEPPDFSGRYVDGKGESRLQFALPKRETLILVSGYSVTMRAKIIDRWQELEQAKAAAPRLPATYREALLALAAEQEVIEQQQALIGTQAAQIEDAAPKVAHFPLHGSSTHDPSASRQGRPGLA